MIVTFYSYKGGVGRSMALANVANWLRLQGLKVLVVDWDLEAPGIECFFVGGTQARKEVHASPGVVDLVAAYMNKHRTMPPAFYERTDEADDEQERRIKVLDTILPRLDSLAVTIRPENQLDSSSNPLYLLSPGARDGKQAEDYAHFVQRLDWTELYEQYDGDAFFAWLRAQIRTQFDIALVDSRTGMTEVGGVCTRELPDFVIAFCAPNAQNLRGCEMVVRPLLSQKIVKVRGGRTLDTAIVPTRYENNESDRLLVFEREFKSALAELAELARDAGATPMDPAAMWDLRIPYIPRYAYGETLCVNAPDRVEDLERPYVRLSRFVASALIRSLADYPESQAAISSRSPELMKLAPTVLTPGERMEYAFQALAEKTQKAAHDLLLRLVELTDPANPRSAVPVTKPLARFRMPSVSTWGTSSNAALSSSKPYLPAARPRLRPSRRSRRSLCALQSLRLCRIGRGCRSGSTRTPSS